MPKEVEVEVRLMFGHVIQNSNGDDVTRRIKLAADGSDSVLAVKEKVAVSVIDHGTL